METIRRNVETNTFEICFGVSLDNFQLTYTIWLWLCDSVTRFSNIPIGSKNAFEIGLLRRQIRINEVKLGEQPNPKRVQQYFKLCNNRFCFVFCNNRNRLFSSESVNLQRNYYNIFWIEWWNAAKLLHCWELHGVTKILRHSFNAISAYKIPSLWIQ